MKKPRSTPRHTKTTYTVPADTWAQLKKLTGDKTSRGFAPVLGEPGVRFSRDQYLSQLMEGELPRLEKLPANSDTAARVLATEARDRRRDAPQSFAKVNLNLDASVVKRLDAIADEKRIPRNLLLSCFLGLVVRGLRKARNIALDPTNEEWVFDPWDEPYGDLFLSEEDLTERKDAGLAIFAISKLKRVSIVKADEAYWALPRAKRRDLRNRPGVRAAMKKYRKQWEYWKATPVDLDQLL